MDATLFRVNWRQYIVWLSRQPEKTIYCPQLPHLSPVTPPSTARAPTSPTPPTKSCRSSASEGRRRKLTQQPSSRTLRDPGSIHPVISVGFDDAWFGKALLALGIFHDVNRRFLHLLLVDLLARQLFGGHVPEGRGLFVSRGKRQPEQSEGFAQILFDATPEHVKQSERELGLGVTGLGGNPQQRRRFVHRAAHGQGHGFAAIRHDPAPISVVATYPALNSPCRSSAPRPPAFFKSNHTRAFANSRAHRTPTLGSRATASDGIISGSRSDLSGDTHFQFNTEWNGESQMAIFITQGNYTEQAMKGMIDKPEDRASAVANLMESVGAKLLQYFVTTGEYDFLVVSEGKNVTDLVAGLMIAGSTGGVTNLKTVQALTTQDAQAAMKKANTARAGFRSAGAGN